MVLRLYNNALVYASLFLLSWAILCFEIVSTRIASVIFAQDYAFIILSLALLGLGAGGVFSYYRIKPGNDPLRVVHRVLFGLGASLCIFIVATIGLSITYPFVFLFLLFLPFFSSGIVYAQIYKVYSSSSFRLYSSDVSGAAAGSLASLGLIALLGAPNSIILIALVAFTLSAMFLHARIAPGRRILVYAVLAISFVALLLNGRNEFLGMVPIGKFPEKDFYHVYPDVATTPSIIDSRWSVYGRSDLVQYSHQDMVRQLFVDGAAGTQVYRFNGNVQHTGSILQALLLQQTNAIPFLCMTKEEKRSMLVIGPGGGKEVLLGLFGEAGTITGVEVNPDFVRIVRDHKEFDGGIYTDFPNVRIMVEEGRHFVKQGNDLFDIIVMALPSTAQMQNIQPFATSENFLLTKEALEDYLKKLTGEGRLILTVHNEWELMRLLSTAVTVFQESGVSGDEIKNHFVVLEAEYAPTVVIKRNAYTRNEALRWLETCKRLPQGGPTANYLPYGLTDSISSATTRFLAQVSQSPGHLQMFIRQTKDDLSPCTDDRPYFYKKETGIPGELLWLLIGTVGFNLLAVWLPYRSLKRNSARGRPPEAALPLTVFACLGMGFMLLEVSLFQKLVLYLGSPTISLSVLLTSLLVGMGSGSYLGKNIYATEAARRLYIVSAAIVVVGIMLFVASPVVLGKALELALPLRAAVTFLIVLPLAFLLGIPFPSCIQVLAEDHKDHYIPWMYGVNGSMSVLGSVLAVILSMLIGFTPTFFVGLTLYVVVFFVSLSSSKEIELRAVVA